MEDAPKAQGGFYVNILVGLIAVAFVAVSLPLAVTCVGLLGVAVGIFATRSRTHGSPVATSSTGQVRIPRVSKCYVYLDNVMTVMRVKLGQFTCWQHSVLVSQRMLPLFRRHTVGTHVLIPFVPSNGSHMALALCCHWRGSPHSWTSACRWVPQLIGQDAIVCPITRWCILFASL
jgi:hypothetical protein